MKYTTLPVGLALSLALLTGPACGGDESPMLLLPILPAAMGGPSESPADAADLTQSDQTLGTISVAGEEDLTEDERQEVAAQEVAENTSSGPTDSGTNSGDTVPGNDSGSGDTGANSGGGDNGSRGNDSASTGNSSGGGDSASTGNSSGGGDTATAGNGSGDSGSNSGDTGGNSGSTDNGSGGTTTADTGNDSADIADEDDDKLDDEASVVDNDELEDVEFDDDDKDHGNKGEDKDDKQGDKDDAVCEARTVTLDPTGGKWYSDSNKKNSGLYTFWAGQKLTLQVRNNCKAGWYRLSLRASNVFGPLPDDYKAFQVVASDAASGRVFGSAIIRAKDKGSHVGRVLVYLESGSNDINLNWTNDAYKAGEYDANINLEKVVLSKKPKVRKAQGLRRNGLASCQTTGRYFWDVEARSAYTFWANQTISFCFEDLKAGQYEVRVKARNYGSLGLPPKYENFDVNVAADGASSKMSIQAADREWKVGTAIIDVRGGDTSVSVTWLNDSYKEGVYDANIEIRSIRLKRVGDSKRTGLAAFMGRAGGGGRLVLVLSGGAALLGLAALYLYRRRLQSA